jgi:ZIP family zinc transporter
MDEFWTVLALACMPALGIFAGGLVCEFVPTSPRALNRALRAAAGILLAVVAVEIISEALARCRLGRWRSLSCSVAAATC